MSKRYLPVFLLASGLGLLSGSAVWIAAQAPSAPQAPQAPASDDAIIRKVVDMVQLNVAVTDKKGNYVTGLRPSDFAVVEDKLPQKIATFEEGQEAPRQVDDPAPGKKTRAPGEVTMARIPVRAAAKSDPDSSTIAAVQSAVSGASVFILFDTSNYMYRARGFVFAQDAIADFVRSLGQADRVAFYSYSRDLSRNASLTADRSIILHGVRETVNGDNSALYDSLLLTIKDAGQHTGRKAVVVFSNGPDNSSMVPPEDVGELAQSEGVPIYMVSTHEAKLDAVTATVFERISADTGGEAYFAKNWQEQEQAFTSIRDDLAHLYLLSYYPQPNPNRGWRAITVKLVGPHAKEYHVRTREGYRPLPVRASADPIPVSEP